MKLNEIEKAAELRDNLSILRVKQLNQRGRLAHFRSPTDEASIIIATDGMNPVDLKAHLSRAVDDYIIVEIQRIEAQLRSLGVEVESMPDTNELAKQMV